MIATGWIFLLPFAVLIFVLFTRNKEAEAAARYAAVAVFLLGAIPGYRGRRMPVKRLWPAVVETGHATVDMIMIGAAASFIIGILQITGLGSAVTNFLVQLAGTNIVALLVIAAVLCIVLGMGMPMLAVYAMLATLVAPALVDLGITPLAAHLFIFYLGMMLLVTRSVAIGAYFAAMLVAGEIVAARHARAAIQV